MKMMSKKRKAFNKYIESEGISLNCGEYKTTFKIWRIACAWQQMQDIKLAARYIGCTCGKLDVESGCCPGCTAMAIIYDIEEEGKK